MPGLPVPQGSKSIVRGRLIDSNKKLKPWRASIAATAQSLGLSAITEGPVFLSCVFVFPRAKSHYNSKGLLRHDAPQFHTRKPDCDKLLRAVGDAISVDCDLLHDDSQITTITGTKRYQIGQEQTGVHIELRVL